eukprot:g8758.t1
MAQVQALKTCRKMWAVLRTSILGQAIVLDLGQTVNKHDHQPRCPPFRASKSCETTEFAKALGPTNSPLAELSIPPTTSSKGAV